MKESETSGAPERVLSRIHVLSVVQLSGLLCFIPSGLIFYYAEGRSVYPTNNGVGLSSAIPVRNVLLYGL